MHPKHEYERPECLQNSCVARAGETRITSCIFCGAELTQRGNLWFHWSQFDAEGRLLSPETPQDVVL